MNYIEPKFELDLNYFKADNYFNSRILQLEDVEHSKNPLAAVKIMCLFEEISTEAYMAGWMSGVEVAMWEIIKGIRTDTNYGAVNIGQKTLEFIQQLHNESGGWVVWDEKTLRFVAEREWQSLYTSSE